MISKITARIITQFITFLFLIFLVLSSISFAHVGYVLDEQELASKKGSDLSFLLNVFNNITNIMLIIVTVIIILLLYFYLIRSKSLLSYIKSIDKRTKQYYIFIPWIARLGLGIALIGSGSANLLVSPLVANFSFSGLFSFLQILTGFFILAGFLTGLAASAAVVFFMIAVNSNFYALGNLDYLGLAIAIIALRHSKPGIDDLFGIPFLLQANVIKNLRNYTHLIVRLTLGAAMMFLAIYEKILNPHISELVVSKYNLTAVIPVSANMWVFAAGIIEFIVAFAIFVGFKTRLFSAIAFLVLTSSFFYFNEQVFSHVTLFAALSILFITDNGKISVDNKLIYKKSL